MGSGPYRKQRYSISVGHFESFRQYGSSYTPVIFPLGYSWCFQLWKVVYRNSPVCVHEVHHGTRTLILVALLVKHQMSPIGPRLDFDDSLLSGVRS